MDAAVWAACPGGTPSWAVRTALAAALPCPGGSPGAESRNDPAARLAVWAGALLLREWPEAAEALGPWLASVPWADLAAAVASGARPVLAVGGGRYLSCAGVAGVLDLETGEPVAEPPPVVETRLVHLDALYHACLERVRKWQTRTPPPGPSGPTRTPRPSASSS